MNKPIPVIDLFAGSGGLGEGFASLKDADGNPVFKIIMSIEMETQAHKTLTLRSFFRKIYCLNNCCPKEYLDYIKKPNDSNFQKLIQKYPTEWIEAQSEAVNGTLSIEDTLLVAEAKRRLREYDGGPCVLIGGPPCQAYSLAGRARRTKEKDKLEKDVKQTLYKCYLQFIEELDPKVFVMENVKGILSAKLKGKGIFGLIEQDMVKSGYEVNSLVSKNPKGPQDFVVHAEEYGVPQARHRVILLGTKKGSGKAPILTKAKELNTVRDALDGIPSLRSDFSNRSKNIDCSWEEYIKKAAFRLIGKTNFDGLDSFLEKLPEADFPTKTNLETTSRFFRKSSLKLWYRERLGKCKVLPNHQTRSHMAKDLDRYLFCASFAQVMKRPAKIGDFPDSILPKHMNVSSVNKSSTVFSDRFRVQLFDSCSTTITSHIAKDGHYYIHPDPVQCRSLTVREAARLQTFPDDYFFEGNRTSQYQQVGNAVPPYLAAQIAKVVASAYSK